MQRGTRRRCLAVQFWEKKIAPDGVLFLLIIGRNIVGGIDTADNAIKHTHCASATRDGNGAKSASA